MNRILNNPMIIAELSSQFLGDMGLLETLILQAKTGGADAVKIQVRNKRKPHSWIDSKELLKIQTMCREVHIELLASVFDIKALSTVLSLGVVNRIKIASRSFLDEELVLKAINSGNEVYLSNGFNKDDFRYTGKDVFYFYCVPEYPAVLDQVVMPNFRRSMYKGYSDHTCGLTACKTAIVRGAQFIEKHFTLSKNLQFSSERGHAGGMTFEDLLELKRFSCENALIKLEK